MQTLIWRKFMITHFLNTQNACTKKREKIKLKLHKASENRSHSFAITRGFMHYKQKSHFSLRYKARFHTI